MATAPVGESPKAVAAGPDELPSPLEEKRRALRQEALAQVLNGEATVTTKGGSSVVKLKGNGRRGHRDRYVELGREKTDKIFVVLAEFGNQRDAAYPDQDTDPNTAGPTTFEGPLHNAIPQPDRSVDNSTVWRANYNPDYYRNLYFGSGKGVDSLKTYYETQSSGRYSVDGQVTDWVKVPYNEARYGRSNGFPCPDTTCSNVWDLLRDAVNQWVADKKAAGQTDAQIKAGLASFDVWDRYDYDGDGDFNEPDGYLDHFQVVHAGGDQADGDPQQGEDAIWSHRWNAYLDHSQGDGPANFPIGGLQIGNTGLWISDYTIQPENGGLSVFAHEYGHDLGLPDDYDTAGGPSNNNEWWTLMAQSRLGAKGDALGEKPGDIGAWQKLQLGWLDYETITAGQKRSLTLGPEEYNSAKPQAAVVVLPKKTKTTTLPTPTSGEFEWSSGAGDDLRNTLTRQVTLPAGAASLTFQANYNIEDCGTTACDYAYVEVNTGGDTWTAIPGSITTAGEGNGIDGLSAGWVPATFDLSAYAGTTIKFRFSYVTDGAAQGTDPSLPSGLFIDDLAVTAGGSTLFTDTVETLDPAWTADGFTRTKASVTEEFDNFYIAGHRSYVSYDKYLKTGPYNFGFTPTNPDLVEHFAYQQGLLVTYWDTSQTNNNVSQHPGEGLSLSVDSHPKPILRSDGVVWRNRIQMYDAPFSLKRADSFTLHASGTPFRITGLPAQPVFDDTQNYFDPTAPGAGVKLPAAGVTIKVEAQNGTSLKVRFGKSRTS
ncbi:MAG TPA: immune inhibitor A domain-containing protein [Kineosporiaceae bacterium]|nr:immune inhibitor A domain-containing protein [Kineosporiaceae bacterium]